MFTMENNKVVFYIFILIKLLNFFLKNQWIILKEIRTTHQSEQFLESDIFQLGKTIEWKVLTEGKTLKNPNFIIFDINSNRAGRLALYKIVPSCADPSWISLLFFLFVSCPFLSGNYLLLIPCN